MTAAPSSQQGPALCVPQPDVEPEIRTDRKLGSLGEERAQAPALCGLAHSVENASLSTFHNGLQCRLSGVEPTPNNRCTTVQKASHFLTLACSEKSQNPKSHASSQGPRDPPSGDTRLPPPPSGARSTSSGHRCEDGPVRTALQLRCTKPLGINFQCVWFSTRATKSRSCIALGPISQNIVPEPRP